MVVILLSFTVTLFVLDFDSIVINGSWQYFKLVAVDGFRMRSEQKEEVLDANNEQCCRESCEF